MPQKQNLMRAHDELFRRGPDETFPSLQALYEFCRGEKERSDDHWRPPADLAPHSNGSLRLNLGEGSAPYRMNDWSFTQLCGLAGVSKETVNRLSPGTARLRPPDLETRRIEGCRSYLLAETGVWEILVGADKTA